MTIRAWVLVWALLLAGLALACGGEEAGVSDAGAPDVAAETGATPGAAGEGAADVAAQGGAGGEATRTRAATRCLEFAAREAWAEALKPCTKANAKDPGDAEIERALQQARAAAETAAP